MVNKIELAFTSYDETCKGAITRFEYNPPSNPSKTIVIPYSLTKAEVGGVVKVIGIHGSVPNGQSIESNSQICLIWGQKNEELVDDQGKKVKSTTSLRDTCNSMVLPLSNSSYNFAFVGRSRLGWCATQLEIQL
jgi:hypothetical protein